MKQLKKKKTGNKHGKKTDLDIHHSMETSTSKIQLKFVSEQTQISATEVLQLSALRTPLMTSSLVALIFVPEIPKLKFI